MSGTTLDIADLMSRRPRTEADGVAIADRNALGTTARLVVWPPGNLTRTLSAVDRVLAALDAQASRFRSDSEISVLHSAGAGVHRVSDGLAEVIAVALAAAKWTEGRCDPTIGGALIRLGYDRDFAAIAPDGDARHVPDPLPSAGWSTVLMHENDVALPAGVLLDLGATAKGLGADRAAAAAYDVVREGGLLVSLGGDLAVAGRPPAGGWPVLVADEHRQVRAAGPLDSARGRAAGPAGEVADPATAQQVRLLRGGLATSSVTCRQWSRGGMTVHHIVDPRTGLPADSPWRTVTVAAATCAEANAAATAAIVAGPEAAGWLTANALPARLVGHDGAISRTAGWPEAEDGLVEPPATSRLTSWSSRRMA